MPEPSSLQRLTEHVYYSIPDGRTDRPTLALVRGKRHTLLYDIGASVAHTGYVLQQAESLGIPAPDLAVLSHWHWDHWFGIDALQIPIIAQRETVRQMAIQAAYDWSDQALDQRVADGREVTFCRDMMKLELPDRSGLRLRTADIVFDDRLTLDLGGITCQVMHVGGDHAADAVVVYVVEEQVMLLSDCLYSTVYGLPQHYTPAKLRAMLAHFDHLPAEYYLLGHHEQAVTAAECQQWIANLRRCADLVEQYGKDRNTIIEQFSVVSGHEPDADELEDIEAFLAAP
jgi:glyoxylase-like metal-dependent hydrolase (beta-lactamase superfamily II)